MAKQEYKEPVTYWCINYGKIVSILVAAETDHSIWVVPDKKHDWTGRVIPPRMRMKRNLPTFHGFEEAKNELIAWRKRELAHLLRRCREAEEALSQASELVPPMAPADA